MRYLLDTHIFLALVEDRYSELPSEIRQKIEASGHKLYLSVASIWEIGIKVRIGKLPLKRQLEELPEAAERADVTLLSINADHALAHALPEPPTRDPFDRMLLAQCLVEGRNSSRSIEPLPITLCLRHPPKHRSRRVTGGICFSTNNKPQTSADELTIRETSP